MIKSKIFVPTRGRKPSGLQRPNQSCNTLVEIVCDEHSFGDKETVRAESGKFRASCARQKAAHLFAVVNSFLPRRCRFQPCGDFARRPGSGRAAQWTRDGGLLTRGGDGCVVRSAQSALSAQRI